MAATGASNTGIPVYRNTTKILSSINTDNDVTQYWDSRY